MVKDSTTRKATVKAHRGLLISLLGLMILTPRIPASAEPQEHGVKEPAVEAPLRDLWLNDQNRCLRSWLVLGPLPEGAGIDSTAHPVPGQLQTLAGGKALPWVPVQSWQDAVEPAGALGIATYRGHNASPQAAYAFTTVAREDTGEAELSVGTDGPVRVWVNGSFVFESPISRVFMFDENRIPVRLRRGENSILLKLVHGTGPWRFALRVLKPGTLLARPEEIVPDIVSAPSAGLVVVTHPAREPRADRVTLDVVAAGGRVVATRQVARGDTIRFDQAEWPDGAYEIRCTTRTPWGELFRKYLPWYKGDAIAAARKIVESAKQEPPDSTGAAVRMLAAMIVDRLKGTFENLPDDAWRLIHSPLLEYEELMQARSGGRGPVHAGGFVRLAYTDPVDGSPQFARAYLPSDFDSASRWPLVLFLHGFNPPNPPYINFWDVDQRHNAIAEHRHVIYIEPHARENAQYLGIGELDVLRVIQEAKRRFPIDSDRVYISGESMGGSGTWIVASRHPDLFAAAAPFYGGWDYRLLPGSAFSVSPEPLSRPERFAQETQSSFVSAENLLNVPLFVHHGDSDKVVTPEYSRHAVRMLQRWGYNLRYDEMPGWGHEDLQLRDSIVGWFLNYRRVTAPRVVRLRAPDLGAASSSWVRVEGWQEPLRIMKVDAEVMEPGLISLNTENVAGITLSPPAVFRGPGDSLRVVWNGVPHQALLPSSGRLTLWAPGEQPAGQFTKTPELEGGLSRFTTTPFAIVVGTSSADPAMRRVCRVKADAFAALWEAWQHCRPRILNDTEVTPEEEKAFSLLLIGGADANLVTRRMRLPLKTEKEGVTIDGHRYDARDACVQLIYPSPFRAGKYVEVVAGTSPEGLYFWNPLHWHPAFGYPTLAWDWIIRDGRRVSLEPGFGPYRGWVAAGMFDRHWRWDSRWAYPGEAARRAKSPLRHPVVAGTLPAARGLEAFTGRYQLYPGLEATVARTERGLTIEIPPLPPRVLVPEGEAAFGTEDTATPVVFTRSAKGDIDGLVIQDEGQDMAARKLD